MTKASWLLVALLVGISAFLAGMRFQQFRYDDICLDMGGGRNPGNHPICIVEAKTGVWIGSFNLSAGDVTQVTRNQIAGSSQISITLAEKAQKSLRDYTAQNVGADLEIKLDGRVIRRVRIAEPLSAAALSIPDLPDGDATALLRSLSPDT